MKLESEPKTSRLADRIRVSATADDLGEGAARVIQASGRDVRTREMRFGTRTTVAGGALKVRTRGCVVVLSEREHAQKLLRPAERVASWRDPAKMRRRLARRAFGDVQLGQHHHVDIA